MKTLRIPVLMPPPGTFDRDSGFVVASQPILQFKELEVDRVRYDAWKVLLMTSKHKKTTKKYYG